MLTGKERVLKERNNWILGLGIGFIIGMIIAHMVWIIVWTTALIVGNPSPTGFYPILVFSALISSVVGLWLRVQNESLTEAERWFTFERADRLGEAFVLHFKNHHSPYILECPSKDEIEYISHLEAGDRICLKTYWRKLRIAEIILHPFS